MKKSLFAAAFFFIQAISANAQENSSPWLTQYNSARDYRAVVDAALRSPGDGGYFYAHRILSECKVASDNFKKWQERLENNKDQPTYNSSKVALDAIKQRCEKFTEEELSHDYISRIAKEGELGIDPLFMAAKSFSGQSAKRGENSVHMKRIASINAASQVKDPLVVQDLGMRLVVSKDQQSGRTAFRINGTDLPLNSKLDIGLAIDLVPCELGLKCDANDFEVLLPCASQGLCDTSRYDRIQKMSDDSHYNQILNIARTIALSIKSPNNKSKILE